MGHHVTLDDLLEQLRSRGDRVTVARRLVLAELLAAGSEHRTAEGLADRVHRRDPEVHLSTIYRTLDVLEGAGLVVRAGFGDGAATYHLASDHHHHAVCDSCGAVIELPSDAFAALVRRLDRDHGFAARPRHVTIPGLCADCRSA
jgi:Fur family ferric uptake transcriptional regulator